MNSIIVFYIAFLSHRFPLRKIRWISEWDKKRMFTEWQVNNKKNNFIYTNHKNAKMNDYYVITRQNMQMNTNGKNEWVNKQINEYQREEWMGE